MIRPPHFLSLAVLTLAFVPAQVNAQPRAPAVPPPATITAEGTEIFRWLFHQAKIEPMTEPEALERIRVGNFQDVIVVLLPSQGMVLTADQLMWLEFAPRSGGAALVATNAPIDFAPFIHAARGEQGNNTRVTGTPVFGLETQPRLLFMGQLQCPFVEPCHPPRGATGPEWELFRGLDRIATRHPSVLKMSSRPGEFHSVLARFPQTCHTTERFAAFRSRPLTRDEVFAAGGSGPHPHNPNVEFRFLALSDPHVFINGMLVPPNAQEPTDNLEFANRVVSFLSEEEGGGKRKRTRCLFIHNGRTVTRFDDLQSLLRSPPPPISLPNLDWNKLQEKFVDFGNELLDRAQENDVLNQRVLGTDPDEQDHRLRSFLKGLLIVLSVWSILFIVMKVWSARRVQNLPPPPPAGRTAPTGVESPTNGVFDRRERELLRRNNLYEPVQAAIREMFAAAGAVPDDGPRLPPIGISEVVLRPGTLRQALADLWKIGYGRPVVVTVQRWKILEPLFIRAQQAFLDGKWWFRSVGPKPDPTNGWESGA